MACFIIPGATVGGHVFSDAMLVAWGVIVVLLLVMLGHCFFCRPKRK